MNLVEQIRALTTPVARRRWIGRAQFFFSYSWDSPWAEVVSALVGHSARAVAAGRPPPYYWVDIFAVWRCPPPHAKLTQKLLTVKMLPAGEPAPRAAAVAVYQRARPNLPRLRGCGRRHARLGHGGPEQPEGVRVGPARIAALCNRQSASYHIC